MSGGVGIITEKSAAGCGPTVVGFDAVPGCDAVVSLEDFVGFFDDFGCRLVFLLNGLDLAARDKGQSECCQDE